MSKKPPRNGYFYFAKEYQAKNKCSSKQAFDDAAPIWSVFRIISYMCNFLLIFKYKP